MPDHPPGRPNRYGADPSAEPPYDRLDGRGPGRDQRDPYASEQDVYGHENVRPERESGYERSDPASEGKGWQDRQNTHPRYEWQGRASADEYDQRPDGQRSRREIQGSWSEPDDVRRGAPGSARRRTERPRGQETESSRRTVQGRAQRAGRSRPERAENTERTDRIRSSRGGDQNDLNDRTNPRGFRRDSGKELNTGDERPSFFPMESEARDDGRTSEAQPVPGEGGASFPSLGGSRTSPPPRNQPSFRQPKDRTTRRRVPMIAAILAVLMIIGGVAYALGTAEKEESGTSATPTVAATGSSQVTETTAPVTTGAAKKVPVGVFRGTSPSEVQQFSQWLGKDATYAVDYSSRTTWDEVANPTYMLSTWQNSGYTMVYAVAMLPTQVSSVSLAKGADGEYDQYFTTLAQNLVAYGQGDSIIRLGWEFNVGGWTWHPKPDDNGDFVTYWRRIVKAMRAVPGAQDLKFDWNVNNGGDTYDSTVYYPGKKYVDYIGVDVYDISWEEDAYPYPSECTSACRLAHQEAAWANILDARFGLVFWSDFAESQGKKLSLPEWGLWERPDGHGGGDNSYFIQQMYEFIDNPQNNVGYQAYFDFTTDTKGTHALDSMPKAGARFKKLFSK
ncbi:glycosyl hydrolase [Kineosporia sp. NBRC 101731]|uniref:glycosyl hydrolase n=1 Tax=Kineosporia sp. NBRC 101731 TaxID=3032199 RepID=UPI0024A2B434|nr:glycosyl hydrolase [Kineosporia sp. NBRC 101731]GLY31158.1 hypothetical protein Kisp02_45230 [Kineosporia sp. NBRC 101731]